MQLFLFAELVFEVRFSIDIPPLFPKSLPKENLNFTYFFAQRVLLLIELKEIGFLIYPIPLPSSHLQSLNF